MLTVILLANQIPETLTMSPQYMDRSYKLMLVV